MPPLAQLDEALRTASDAAEQLSGKPLAVWFLIVVFLFCGLVCWAIRRLLKEWSDERKANAILWNRFLDYISKDQQNMAILINQANAILVEVVQVLEKLQLKQHDQEVLDAAKRNKP